MEKVKVRVTKSDIKNGFARRSMSCPIALAIKRKTESDNVSVGCGEIWVNDNYVYLHRKKKVREWVRNFDNGEEVKPFEFTMWVP